MSRNTVQKYVRELEYKALIITEPTKYESAGGQVRNGNLIYTILPIQPAVDAYNERQGRQFYHFVQSFPEEDDLTPQEVNAIGLELASREFPDFEVVVATHLDTGHLHNHLVVNSVNCADGKKLHQNAADLQAHRNANDEICLKHGLSVLEKAKRHEKKKRMKPGEYQSGLRGESWKLDLIYVINEALEYADDAEMDKDELVKVLKSVGI